MHKTILFVLLFHVSQGFCQGVFPQWVTDSLKSRGLDQKYVVSPFLQPVFLQADFTGDGSSDIVVLIIEKTTGKKGVLLIHDTFKQYYVFGAGNMFGDGSDDFKWANKWSVFHGKHAYATQFDKKSGDMVKGKEIILQRAAVSIMATEDGADVAGGLIYWDGKKYIWIHQGE